MIASVPDECVSGRTVPPRARAVAARLSTLFCRDVEIVARLNDAQRRLRDANERLWSGLAPDAFGLVYDGTAPAGHSQIAALAEGAPDGGPTGQVALLRALQEAHSTIHHAFHEFQSASEERRQVAVEVGELSWQLTEALMSAGWSADEAEDANVHELSGAVIR